MSTAEGIGAALPSEVTWSEYVRILAEVNGLQRYLSDADIEFLLWECTAWPVAGFRCVRDQLIQEFRRIEEEDQGE